MIPEPETYFRALVADRDPVLERLEKEARAEDIPIVGPAIGTLLYVLTRFSGAENVLEFGAASGYSAIWLARGCGSDACRVVTLEKDPAMAERARRNCDLAGVGPRVEIRIGDALAIAAGMTGTFDLIFLDIEKKDYVRALGDCRRLLRPGGLLVADNIAFSDADPFNKAILADAAWQAVSLYAFMPEHSPEHDGLGLAVRT
jgi:predicted O-methyltransferase YrrM